MRHGSALVALWLLASPAGVFAQQTPQPADQPTAEYYFVIGRSLEGEGKVIILGELVNEDTVPGYVDVQGILIGKNDEQLGEETSFDKISHVLLPKEVTPFRIDFDGVHLSQVKKVTLNPTSILVPASADPVIGVLHQQLARNDSCHTVLQGELLNQSGELVNIPQVLATSARTGAGVPDLRAAIARLMAEKE